MNDDRTNDERLAQMIRAAAPRREIPVGLDTRIMAQIRLHERRRRERRAVMAMAGYCMAAVAAVLVVMCACLQTIDSPEGMWRLLALLAGIIVAMVIACGDRATEILRRL